MSKSVIIMLLCLTVGCSTGIPVVTKLETGRSIVQTPVRFCGETVWTKERELVDPKKKLADAEVDLEILRKKRQEELAFWAGASLFGLALGLALAARILPGWKFWGSLSLYSAALGSITWGASHWLPLLKWAIIPALILGVGRFLYTNKHKSLKLETVEE